MDSRRRSFTSALQFHKKIAVGVVQRRVRRVRLPLRVGLTTGRGGPELQAGVERTGRVIDEQRSYSTSVHDPAVPLQSVHEPATVRRENTGCKSLGRRRRSGHMIQWDTDERPATLYTRIYVLGTRLDRDKRAFEGAEHTLKTARRLQENSDRRPRALTRLVSRVSETEQHGQSLCGEYSAQGIGQERTQPARESPAMPTTNSARRLRARRGCDSRGLRAQRRPPATVRHATASGVEKTASSLNCKSR